jgi:hypothetical protein
VVLKMTFLYLLNICILYRTLFFATNFQKVYGKE